MNIKIQQILLTIICILVSVDNFAQKPNAAGSYPLLIDTILGESISKFMLDPDIDQLDKDFVLGKIEVTNEEWFNNTLSKLSTIPQYQEAFYLHILNVIVLEVDGYQAEIVGSYIKGFLLRSSKVFCEFLSSYKGPEKDLIIEKYSEFLAYEFLNYEDSDLAFIKFEKSFFKRCRFLNREERIFSKLFMNQTRRVIEGS